MRAALRYTAPAQNVILIFPSFRVQGLKHCVHCDAPDMELLTEITALTVRPANSFAA